MIHLVGVSCLSNLIQILKHQKDKDRTREISITVRGLSVNSNTEDNISGLIKKNQVLRDKRINIWHDLISNSISEHKSNWCPVSKCYLPLYTPQLMQTEDLNQPDTVEAIMHTRRQSAPDLSLELRKTGNLMLEIANNLIPKKEQSAELPY